MTYILGWKSHGHAFLCADSAVTHQGPRTSIAGKTSFGESYFSGRDRHVTENALKLINLDTVAFAICGEVSSAIEFIREVQHRIQYGVLPIAALESTAISRTPLPSPNRYSLLASVPDAKGARLFAFNIDCDQRLSEVTENHLVHFGTLPSDLMVRIQQWLGTAIEGLYMVPDMLLIGVLGQLQSYGIHEKLIEHGVGGVFCGIHVDSQVIRWQRDLLIVVHSPKIEIIGMICAIVRDHTLIVRSNVNDSCVYFPNLLTGFISEDWSTRWRAATFDYIRTGPFDFVIFLNAVHRSVTLVEMCRQLKNQYLHVLPSSSITTEESFTVYLNISPSIQNVLRKEPERRGEEWEFSGWNIFPFGDLRGSA